MPVVPLATQMCREIVKLVKNDCRIAFEAGCPMGNHVIGQLDSALAVAAQTYPIERQAGVVDFIQMDMGAKQFYLCLRSQLLPIKFVIN